MSEELDELSVAGLQGEFPKDLAPWAVDTLRIGKVFMHNPVKCRKQLFFDVHPERPVEHGAQA